jgi:hypothetical protein
MNIIYQEYLERCSKDTDWQHVADQYEFTQWQENCMLVSQNL